MPVGLATKVALGGMAGAGMAGALAPEFLFGVSYLEGDPEKIRAAADVLDEIADAIDRHFHDANDAAERVWRNCSGPAVDEFGRFWAEDFGLAVLAVSVKHRRAAAACRAYADVVEDVNHAIRILCWIMTVDMMFTIGYQVLTWKLLQAIMRKKAILFKLSARRSVALVLPTLAYYLADSTAYALGQVAIPLGFNLAGGIETDLSGNEVRAVDHNLIVFLQHFVANMAFDGVADGGTALMSKVPGLRALGTTYHLPNGMALNTGSFVPRVAASTTYSMAIDAQRGDNPWFGAENGLTKEEMYQKFLIHGTRSFIPRLK
ncbi:hypothetical protein GCM10022224_078760 [Nonomuraea antimicrobica]|uniref:Uncharacterized protein n=1 Tax=Nonomuraea antimicrobica TaxID=561173 RepID=A0ABP7D8W6_9ACTN